MTRPHERSRVCVFGGTGFVGRNLVARLAERGYDVRVPTRSRARNRDLLVLPGVELIRADAHDPRALDVILEGASAVVNLVGILNERGRDGSGFHEAHVALVEKLTSASRRQGVKRFVQMSALKANSERGPSHYLRTKGIAEETIKKAAEGAFRYTILQPSVIFGRDDSFVNRFAALLRLLPVFPLAKPRAQFAPVFVGDVVDAVMHALETEEAGDRTYQLCGPEIFTLLEIVQTTARLMGKKRIIIGLPDVLSRAQAWTMELVPGKPFSMDNYRSLTVASTCTENGLEALGITATAMGTVVPGYLGPRTGPRSLDQYRRSPR